MKVQMMNPVTAAGYSPISNVIMLRKDLSPTAKLIYGYLCHLHWRNQDVEEVEPSKETLAEDLGISVSAVSTALTALANAPTCEGDDSEGHACLIKTRRRGLGLTNVYLIFDPELPETDESRNAESVVQERGNGEFPTRARSLQAKTKETKRVEASASTGVEVTVGPPPLHKVEGQNLAFNALRDLCGIKPNDRNREGEVAVALNGGRGVRTGIRELVWGELVEATFGGDARAAAAEVHHDPSQFEYALVATIERRVQQYEQAWGGRVALTPTALAKWWLSLEGMAKSGTERSLTADEMARFPDA